MLKDHDKCNFKDRGLQYSAPTCIYLFSFFNLDAVLCGSMEWFMTHAWKLVVLVLHPTVYAWDNTKI